MSTQLQPITREQIFASDYRTTDIEESYATVSVTGNAILHGGTTTYRAEARIDTVGNANGSDQRVALLMEVDTSSLSLDGEFTSAHHDMNSDELPIGVVVAMWKSLGVAIARAQRLGILPTEDEIDAASRAYFVEYKRRQRAQRVKAQAH